MALDLFGTTAITSAGSNGNGSLFEYDVPSGSLRIKYKKYKYLWITNNMAYSTISKPILHFNTKLYTGNGSAGNAQTGVGFQPDWVWIKARSIGYDNNLFDALRGTEKRLRANDNPAQDTVSGSVTAFGTDGFTVGADAGVNANSQDFCIMELESKWTRFI